LTLSSTVNRGITEFLDLSCRSTSLCWTVGSNGAHPAVAYWNGSSFRLDQAASSSGYGDLGAVGCANTRCVALGNRHVSSNVWHVSGEQ
jgi:hypothetical protein